MIQFVETEMSKEQEMYEAMLSNNFYKIIELLHGATADLKEDNDRADNYDPSPYCQYCGARQAKECDCGPIADNN